MVFKVVGDSESDSSVLVITIFRLDLKFDICVEVLGDNAMNKRFVEIRVLRFEQNNNKLWMWMWVWVDWKYSLVA